MAGQKFVAGMHRHARENRNDIHSLAKGAVLGMIFGAIGGGMAFIALIVYLKSD